MPLWYFCIGCIIFLYIYIYQSYAAVVFLISLCSFRIYCNNCMALWYFVFVGVFFCILNKLYAAVVFFWIVCGIFMYVVSIVCCCGIFKFVVLCYFCIRYFISDYIVSIVCRCGMHVSIMFCF